jgi:hypothetical protein
LPVRLAIRVVEARSHHVRAGIQSASSFWKFL